MTERARDCARPRTAYFETEPGDLGPGRCTASKHQSNRRREGVVVRPPAGALTKAMLARATVYKFGGQEFRISSGAPFPIKRLTRNRICLIKNSIAPQGFISRKRCTSKAPRNSPLLKDLDSPYLDKGGAPARSSFHPSGPRSVVSNLRRSVRAKNTEVRQPPCRML